MSTKVWPVNNNTLRQRSIKNLQALHPLLAVFLDKRVLRPNGNYKAKFNTVDYFDNLLRNNGHMDDEYTNQLYENLSDIIIMQCPIEALHWFRFMVLLLENNYKDITKYNPSDDDYYDDFDYNELIIYYNRLASEPYLSTSVKNEIRKGIARAERDIANMQKKPSLMSVFQLDLDNLNHNNTFAEKPIIFPHNSKCTRDFLSIIEDVRGNINIWDKQVPGNYFYDVSPALYTYIIQDITEKSASSRWFPLKKATAAETKANVYLDDLLMSIEKEDNKYYSDILPFIPKLLGLSNDQATLAISSHYILYRKGMQFNLLHYVLYLHNHDLVKAVSDLTKLLGVGHNYFLNLFAEGDCLQGRGSIKNDTDKEIAKLTETDGPEGENIIFEKGIIYKHAIELFSKALPRIQEHDVKARFNLFFEHTDEYWLKRHLHCVNGAHHLPSDSNLEDLPKGITKTRMVWLENTKNNILFKTTPKREITISDKFDASKVRTIKSEDTLGYVNEDYIMKTVEREWLHNECILNPGLNTKKEEADRVANMKGDTYVLLDFKGMELQQSIQTGVELIKALCDFLGLPDHMKEWLVTAEKEQFIKYKGKVRKVKYSLMTGRRMTTFMNTVLNYIYCEIIIVKLEFKPSARLHIGDDVTLRFLQKTQAIQCLKACLKSKSNFNKRKQSCGPCAEFLRMCTYRNLSMGYVNRSLVSFVCGSWVNKLRLAGYDTFAIFYRYGWTIDNRAMLDGVFSILFTYSLFARTGIAYNTCNQICAHQISVNGGPVSCDRMVTRIVSPRVKLIFGEKPKGLQSYASSDYVSTLANVLKSVVNTEIISNVKEIMSTASYSKSLMSGYENLDLQHSTIELTNLKIELDSNLLKRVHKGILSLHPTLPSLKGLLTHRQLDDLAMVYLGKRFEGKMSVEEWFFGHKTLPVRCQLGINFDDACQMGQYLFYNNFRVGINITSERLLFF